MTAQTPAQQAFLALARRLPLRTRRELSASIHLLEDMLGLPHELTVDQRKQVAGSNGKSPHAVRRETSREFYVQSRATGSAEHFNLFDAATLMGLAPLTLKQLCGGGRVEERVRPSSPWYETTDILRCERVEHSEHFQPLRPSTIKWLSETQERRAKHIQRLLEAQQ